MSRQSKTPLRGRGEGNHNATESEYKVEDRRHWVVEDAEDDDGSEPVEPPAPAQPSIVEEYRGRAEEAERKLQDYIEAFKSFKQEQDEFRERLNRDVERRVELKFGGLVEELLESIDNLDLALEHVGELSAAESLARGVTMARDRFLATLERHGVERLAPDGASFDPNEAEAVRVDPVDDAARDGSVTETLRAGYRLGQFVIRPAKVAVGRYVEAAPERPGVDGE